ncbi:MAG: YggS family pyridoxal phosphate-dependent enzyme [Gammaproteobacteria bacterium]|nr:YggS family pyridoxal phosphate-dependent enzyme [Gammaproteobacteria bacterium]MDH4256943.1 YggS family pyridoxal phosphate-dependent enzyme [Gammaproteobacteria bacterium]MDH5309296.1 YggS family pyridoxal phosphate-dependent enzyme [Gammaproteobacteria bacterium]
MINITENLGKIHDLLAEAALRAGRSPDSVRLLAVSKKKPVEAILEAAAAGQLDFGENFVQEGVTKIEAAGRKDLVWHFIGHLQTNKSRAVAESFQWVHTIDRAKIARRLSEQRPQHAPDLNVCIQVNVDREEGKSGVLSEDLPELAACVARLPGIRLRGLMCIPAIRAGFSEQRKPFAELRRLLDELCADGLDLDTLSMGMSDDYEAAIQEGATIVRIGTAIFGARD